MFGCPNILKLTLWNQKWKHLSPTGAESKWWFAISCPLFRNTKSTLSHFLANEVHKVIISRDTPHTFVYADPPYIDTAQGHYGGYTDEHFRRDLDTLANMKGLFLLSSYPSATLDKYISLHGWHSIEFAKSLSVGNAAVTKQRRNKTEVLTANYPISVTKKSE